MNYFSMLKSYINLTTFPYIWFYKKTFQKMSDIQVNVNGEMHQAIIDEDNHSNIIVDEKSYKIKLLRDHKNNVRTYLVNDKIMSVQVDENSDGEFKILHNNFEYQTEIKTQTRALLEKFLKTTGSSKGEGSVKSPMPGLIVKINCQVGDEVSEGDKIVIIEAMKMENSLSAPASGKIKTIKVKEGDAVDKGAVLIEIDTD